MRPVYYAGTDPQRWAARSTLYGGHKANNTDRAWSHWEGWFFSRYRKPVFCSWTYLNASKLCSNVQRVADPGSRSDFFPSRIPDPNIFYPGSRSASKNLSIFNTKNWFLCSRKYDPGCSSWDRIPYPDPGFLPIPDPGSRGQKGTGSRIRNTKYVEWLRCRTSKEAQGCRKKLRSAPSPHPVMQAEQRYIFIFLFHSLYGTGSNFAYVSGGGEGSVVEPEPRSLPKPKLRIAAPAPFYLPQTWRNFIEKNHGCWRRFCKFLQF